MTRFICSLLALLLLADPLAAHHVKMLIVKPGFVDNEFIYGRGKVERTTPIVIPQTNSGPSTGPTWGDDNPTKKVTGVHGLGRTTSILQFTDDTDSSPYLITTENYDSESIYTAEVRDLTINGPHQTALGQFPQGEEPPAVSSTPTAVRLRGMNSVVENCEIKNYYGNGVSINRDVGTGYTTTDYRITGCNLSRLLCGIYASSDLRVADNQVAGCSRGLLVPTDVGPVQSTHNNYFGCHTCIHVMGVQLTSVNDIASDATYGVYTSGAGLSKFTNLYTQHCWHTNIKNNAPGNSYMNCTVRVASASDLTDPITVIHGVEFGNRGNSFLGGSVELSSYEFGGPSTPHVNIPAASTAFVFSNGQDQGGDPHNNTIRTDLYGYSSEFDLRETAVDFQWAGSGNTIEINVVSGFNYGASSHARLLKIVNGDTATAMKNNRIIFRGPLSHAVANPGNFIDIPSPGLDATNTVTIIDTFGSEDNSVTLTPNTPY